MNLAKKNKIKQSLQNTKLRRENQTCKVITCKVDSSTLNNSTKFSLSNLFLQAKWLYNSILSSEDIPNYDTKLDTVQVKIKDTFETRELNIISAQMKQGIKTRIFSSMAALKSLKSKGHNIGKLKFKREINSIPLKQHLQTFTILKNSKRIKIQGIKQPLRVNGLDQLPKNYEIANANLTKLGNDYYVKVTIYTEKEIRNVPNQSIGIDFGCSSQLSLSNGEKIEFQVPVSKRIKTLDKQLARKVKGSKNRYKIILKRQKSYQKITNKREEIKNQIVNKLVKNYSTICFQDESIESWKKNGHGKKIQFSAIGGIISALKRKAVTPIVVEKYYPSTQICSKCGNKQRMNKRIRTYNCVSCNCSIDRDINAAINIEKEGLGINKIPMECREFKPVEIRTSFSILETKLEKVQSMNQETHGSLVHG
jgi:transposase